MKPMKSKAQERREIQQQIEAYLQGGGAVEAVAPGVSGREAGSYKLPQVSFSQPPATRTPLLEEIRAIEARRRRSPAPAKRMAPARPRRVLIRDDFGEPLRWGWTDS